MWRLKKSLPAAGIDLTLASLELQPFRFTQVCAPEKFYDVRVRQPREWAAFLKTHRSAIHLINHAYEYVDLLEQLRPELLEQLTLVGICHTDQDYYYHHLCRLDAKLAGIIAVSPRLRAKSWSNCSRTARAPSPSCPTGTCRWRPSLRRAARIRPSRCACSFQRPPASSAKASARSAGNQPPPRGGRRARRSSPSWATAPTCPSCARPFGRGRHIPLRLLGPRAPWEMAPLLAAHDIFLQVSEFEGASVSLMEAMVAGLVPVVTGTASGTELLEAWPQRAHLARWAIPPRSPPTSPAWRRIARAFRNWPAPLSTMPAPTCTP